MPPTDLRAEKHRLFENLEQVLNLSGATIADVVSVNKFLVDIDRETQVAVSAMCEYFKRMPTSTTVEVLRLVPRDMRVEVSAIAAVRPT